MDLLRSLPLGLYLEQPVTWLHHLDPRVKLAWLSTFLAAPLLADNLWRLGLVGLLILITLSAVIPRPVWRRQVGWLLIICFWVLLLTAVLPDGLDIFSRPRLPPTVVPLLPGQHAEVLPQPTPYRYVLLNWGVINVTRQSFSLGVRVSTLLFTLVYSSNLYLLTTAPEEITAGIESLLQPLRRCGWPVTEICLTLTLSLRFIPLVMEEIQNLVRSVRTRAINWRKLGVKNAIRVWLTVAERLVANLLLRSEQIASAMQVRGFTSPDQHQVVWHQLGIGWRDWLALMVLSVLWVLRLFWA